LFVKGPVSPGGASVPSVTLPVPQEDVCAPRPQIVRIAILRSLACIFSQQESSVDRSYIPGDVPILLITSTQHSRHVYCSSFCKGSTSKRGDFEMPDNGSINESTTGTATALSQTAQDYGQKISEVASQAKDYVSEKVSVVGDKIKDLQNADLGELAENAKEYARKKPGQALLISAGVGLLLGLIIRGRR
jgi:ElaB/YqjD/DUF883 family membrane-anchored ribosome-binding protein